MTKFTELEPKNEAESEIEYDAYRTDDLEVESEGSWYDIEPDPGECEEVEVDRDGNLEKHLMAVTSQ